MVNGVIQFNFTRAHMEKAVGGIDALIGKTLKVSVSFQDKHDFYLTVTGYQVSVLGLNRTFPTNVTNTIITYVSAAATAAIKTFDFTVILATII